MSRTSALSTHPIPMSGIFGCWHVDREPVGARLLTQCLERLSPQGAESIDSWFEGSIGVGQKSTGSQNRPTGMADTRVACAFDGRIDNRAELLEALSKRWSVDDDSPDACLVRTAY